MKNEETLALILEEINKKLDIIINEQKEIKDEKTFGKNGRINTRESIEKIETACINKNSQRI